MRKNFKLHNCDNSNLQPRLAAYRMNPTFCLALPVIVCRMPIIGASFGRFFDISSFAQSRLTSPPSGHIMVSLWLDFSIKLTHDFSFYISKTILDGSKSVKPKLKCLGFTYNGAKLFNMLPIKSGLN